MVPHLACFVQGRDPEREDVSGAITGYTSSTRYSVRFYRLCTVHAHAQFHFVRTSLFLHAVHTMRTPCVSDAHNVRMPCAYRCSLTTARPSVTSGPTRSE